MRHVTLIFVAFLMVGCAASHTYNPVASRSAPQDMIDAVVREFPDATLEHVVQYIPKNPYATSYPYWEGLVIVNNRVVADAYHGLGRTSFKVRYGS